MRMHPWRHFTYISVVIYFLIQIKSGAEMINNYSRTLWGFIFGKMNSGINISECTQTVVIQTVRHATLTGLEQTGKAKTETGCGAKTNLKQQRWTTSQMETNKPPHRWSADPFTATRRVTAPIEPHENTIEKCASCDRLARCKNKNMLVKVEL